MALERRFGIEIEHHMPGGPDETKRILRTQGFPEWANKTCHEYLGHTPRGMDDVETRSPILCGKDGFEELQAVMRLLKDSGARMSRGCGAHVHHDGPDYKNDMDAVARLVRSWHQNQAVIDKFVTASRRNNQYCPKWTENHVVNIETNKRIGGARGALNINSLRGHGSVEIRQHHGTLNFEEIEAWIKFGQAFLRAVQARKTPLGSLDEPALLLRRIKTPKQYRMFLLNKALTSEELDELGEF